MIDRFGPSESCGGLSDIEIQAMIHHAGATPTEAEQLRLAARRLHIAKMLTNDATPWRELLEDFRKNPVMNVSVDVVDVDGTQRIQTVYTERGFGLKGREQTFLSAIEELDRAVSAVEHFDPFKHLSSAVDTASRSVTSKQQKNRRQPTKMLRVAGLIDALSYKRTAATVDGASAEQIKRWLELDGFEIPLATVKRAKKYWLEKRQSEPDK